MCRRRRVLFSLIFGLSMLVAPVGAQAQEPAERPLAIGLAVKERGWIRLAVQATPGRVVRVSERLPGGTETAVTEVQMAGSTSGRKRVLPWRCDRLRRTVVLTAVAPDGRMERAEAEVRTPRCTRRVSFGQVTGRAGRGLTVRLLDRWTVGDYSVEVCAARGGSRPACQTVRFPRGSRTRAVKLAVRQPGRYRLEIRSRFGQRTRSTTLVRRAIGRFRLLATGDSMIQIIDSYLDQRLTSKGAKVTSDAHISTGITKPEMLNWVKHAVASARAEKPDVTVVFLGANDGFNVKTPGGETAGCCRGAWVNVYASRVRTMMRSYLRSGSGRVYWLLLPTPRGSTFQRVFRGVNLGIERAARSFDRSEVQLLDLRKTFTPGGRFRAKNRQSDGVHLNTSGASIAANAIIRALRRDGYVE